MQPRAFQLAWVSVVRRSSFVEIRAVEQKPEPVDPSLARAPKASEGRDHPCHIPFVDRCQTTMPTSVKDRKSSPADWQSISGLSFPKELYMSMLIEHAERELVEQVRLLTWRLVTRGHFVED